METRLETQDKGLQFAGEAVEHATTANALQKREKTKLRSCQQHASVEYSNHVIVCTSKVSLGHRSLQEVFTANVLYTPLASVFGSRTMASILRSIPTFSPGIWGSRKDHTECVSEIGSNSSGIFDHKKTANQLTNYSYLPTHWWIPLIERFTANSARAVDIKPLLLNKLEN